MLTRKPPFAWPVHLEEHLRGGIEHALVAADQELICVLDGATDDEAKWLEYCVNQQFATVWYVFPWAAAMTVIGTLMAQSQWFSVQPNPDNTWTITVKAGEESRLKALAHELAIGEVSHG